MNSQMPETSYGYRLLQWVVLVATSLVALSCSVPDDNDVPDGMARLQISIPGMQQGAQKAARTAANAVIPDEITSLLIEVIDQQQVVLQSVDAIGTSGAVSLLVDAGVSYILRGTAIAGDEILFLGETQLNSLATGVRVQVSLLLEDQVQLLLEQPTSSIRAGDAAIGINYVLSGLNNIAMNWYVDNVQGGSVASGFISSSGQYTPPANSLTDIQVTIKAEPVAAPSFAQEIVVSVLASIQSGLDADGDGLPDAVETNTGIFVSASDTGTDPNAANTDNDAFSDGEEVLFLFSDPNDINSVPITAGLKMASFDDGNTGSLDGSRTPAVNADGSVVVYVSNEVSSNPVDDNGNARTLYLQRANELLILNKDESGVQQSGFFSLFGNPSVSDAGDRVVFISREQLTSADTNSVDDVYLRDTNTNTISMVSTDASSGSSDGYISGDGRYVAFTSAGTNLIADDTNGANDIFVKDLQDGSVVRVSVDSNGVESNGYSFKPALSQDGRYVSFSSTATNLVAGDTNAKVDIFRHDRDADGNGVFDEAGGIETIRINVSSQGAEANDSGLFNLSAISDDGNRIVFDSVASNLIGATGVDYQVLLHDVNAGTTELVSADKNGTPADGRSSATHSSISGDGRYVVFESRARNLVVANLLTTVSPSASVVYVKDTATGDITLLSAADPASSSSGGEAVISSDGRYVVFSGGDNLVAGDTNGVFDVFLAFNHTDTDGDRLFDYGEFLAGSDASLKDTDGDNAYDGAEIAWGLDPLNPVDVPADLSVPLIIDFEADDGGFIGTGLWQHGTPTSGPGVANSGVNVWATNLSGGYAGNQNDFLSFPAFTKQAGPSAILSFSYYMDGIEFEDYAYMEVSLNSGNYFSFVKPVGGYPDCCDVNDDFNVWAIQQPGYGITTFDLSGKPFEGQIVQFRLKMEATGNNASNKAGMYIDDVYLGAVD